MEISQRIHHLEVQLKEGHISLQFSNKQLEVLHTKGRICLLDWTFQNKASRWKYCSPAPPLPLNLQRISSSAPQSVLPSEPNLFATFLFQASFYLFLLAGSCESCQMELTWWPLANSASRYYSLQFGRWTLMLSSRILAQISRWRCHYKYIMQSTFLGSGSRSTPYWFQLGKWLMTQPIYW